MPDIPKQIYRFEVRRLLVRAGPDNAVYDAYDPLDGAAVELYEWRVDPAAADRVTRMLVEVSSELSVGETCSANGCLYLAVSAAAAPVVLDQLQRHRLFVGPWTMKDEATNESPSPSPQPAPASPQAAFERPDDDAFALTESETPGRQWLIATAVAVVALVSIGGWWLLSDGSAPPPNPAPSDMAVPSQPNESQPPVPENRQPAGGDAAATPLAEFRRGVGVPPVPRGRLDEPVETSRVEPDESESLKQSPADETTSATLPGLPLESESPLVAASGETAAGEGSRREPDEPVPAPTEPLVSELPETDPPLEISPPSVVQFVSVPPCADVDVGSRRLASKAPTVGEVPVGRQTIAFSWPERGPVVTRREYTVEIEPGTMQIIGRRDSISVTLVDRRVRSELLGTQASTCSNR